MLSWIKILRLWNDGECDTIVKVSVICLSYLRNEVKKLFYTQFLQIWLIFLFDSNIAKMHIFCSFFSKRLLLFQAKLNNLYRQQILQKLMHLRFWYDGADFRTEAQKFFNARTLHTTWRHQEDDLEMHFNHTIFRYKSI